MHYLFPPSCQLPVIHPCVPSRAHSPTRPLALRCPCVFPARKAPGSAEGTTERTARLSSAALRSASSSSQPATVAGPPTDLAWRNQTDREGMGMTSNREGNNRRASL